MCRKKRPKRFHIIQVRWETFTSFYSKFIPEIVYDILSESPMFYRTYYKKNILVSFSWHTVHEGVKGPRRSERVPMQVNGSWRWAAHRGKETHRGEHLVYLSSPLNSDSPVNNSLLLGLKRVEEKEARKVVCWLKRCFHTFRTLYCIVSTRSDDCTVSGS